MNQTETEERVPLNGEDEGEPDEVVLHVQSMNSIVEIAEASGAARVNAFLGAGYILLAIQQGSRPMPPRNNTEQFTVRKFPIYIVGRSRAVEHFDPPAAAVG